MVVARTNPVPYFLVSGRIHHSFQAGRTSSSLVASTSESSSHRGRGGTLWRTSGARGAHPTRTPLTDHSSASSLSVVEYVNTWENAFLTPLFLQPRVALLGLQP